MPCGMLYRKFIYHHLVPESCKEQEPRVKIAGFPDCLIKSLSGIFLKEIREGSPEKNRNREKEGMAIIPYLHGVSHKVMKTGRKCGVRVMFSAPNKLSQLCRKVNSGGQSFGRCVVRHTNAYTGCMKDEVNYPQHFSLSQGAQLRRRGGRP